MDRFPLVRNLLAILLVVGALEAGCSRYIDPNVPEPIRPFVEPEFGGAYLLYRPSQYDRQYAWPLVVVCPSSFPDSANKRIRAWTQLAEADGFLVAVPRLRGTKRFWPPKPARQIRLQRDDEARLLAAVRHIRAGHHISEDRIFIHGRAAGAYAALFTGLRHPEIFRAITLSQPKFDERFLAGVAEGIDPHQPVLVRYRVTDRFSGRPGRRCADWLRAQGVNLTEDSAGIVHPEDNQPVVAFFEDVLRRIPRLHIRALPEPGATPLTVRFKLRCSHQLSGFLWDFGDGAQSKTDEPVHTYPAPGTYPVSVSVEDPTGVKHRRSARLRVPEITLSRIRPSARSNR